jgi:2-amino-4-hydroxy-6-hydroxymethyldihydropteridine diphosphokinase
MTRRLHAVASQETTSAGTVTATLGLGSNIGDKSGNIDQAVAMLGQDGDVRVVAISRKYSSPPWGDLDQDWFVNACIGVETKLSPRELLARCQTVEADMGRVRLRKWGPRIIDVDILTYGDEQIREPDLIVPHPLIAERPFVLVPLADIAPHLVINGKPIRALIEALHDTGMEPVG